MERPPPVERPELPRPGDAFPAADWEFVRDEPPEQPGRGGVGPRGGSVPPPASYRQALGGDPIPLGGAEFRLLRFLATRPYHAFTRREIAAALRSTDDALPPRAIDLPAEIDVEQVDACVASLRAQLGVLHDLVQTVPYVGFRFKP